MPDFAQRHERQLRTLLNNERQLNAKATHAQKTLDARVKADVAAASAAAATSATYEPAAPSEATQAASAALVEARDTLARTRDELAYQRLPLLDDDAGEPMQLCFEEAFFLMFAMRCLRITTRDDAIALTTEQCWRLFQRLDARFVESYVAYHYYRSHGW